MKTFSWTICLAVLLAGATAAWAGPAGILVKDGQAKGCIAIPEGTENGRVLTAAEDLAGYIQQISGAQVPVCRDSEQCQGFRILIGSTRLAPPDPAEVTEKEVGFDGFIIRSVPDGVVIAGRNDHGTANGVYHFAEEVLGLHWYSLEDDGPACPKRKTIQIPKLKLTIKPEFDWRGQFYSIIRKYLPEESQANRERWRTFNRLWGINAETNHVFADIVPDSLFAAHPEYFALIGGRRVSGHSNVQRCLSNPTVLKRAIEYTVQRFEEKPNLRFASLSSNDGGGWCECDNCKAMGPTQSHRSLAFCNAVAEANEEKYPDRGYFFFAYQGTLEAPVGMEAHRNVVPVIAPMSQCRVHPISSDCPDAILKRRVFKGWQQVAGRISWYPYLNGGAFTGPGVITHAEEARFVRDAGSIGGFREHTAAPQANWAMLNWMEVKLMWDVDQDPVKLRRQFIEGYYGPDAADALERVYDSLEKGLRNSSIAPRPKSPYGHNFINYAFLKPFMQACRQDIDTALAIARTEKNAAYRRRIARDMGALLGKMPDDLAGLLKEE